MEEETIAKLILTKGLKNVNLSMFTDEQRKVIMQKLAEHYVRLGKMDELLGILEQTDKKSFEGIMKQRADQLLSLGDYKTAAAIYDKLGEKEIAASIRDNFL